MVSILLEIIGCTNQSDQISASPSFSKFRRNVLLIRLRKRCQGMRTDSRQNLGHHSPAEHVWISDEIALLKRDSLPEDLQPLLQAIEVDRCIAVQSRRYLGETRALLEHVEKHEVFRDFVRWVDLCSPDLPGQWELTGFNRDLDVVFEAFTPDRLTIGSDWSVCILSEDYASTMQVVIDIAQQFQPRVQSGMFGKNCARHIRFATVLSRSSQ